MKEFMLKIALSALAYFSPIYEMFIALMLFVLADLVTGIIASKRHGIPRSSRRLRKSAAKLVNYLSILVLAYVAERAFKVEWFVAHRAIGAFICAVEFLSILENLAVVTGNPVFVRMLQWIRGKASSNSTLIKEILNEKNDLPVSGGSYVAGSSERMQNPQGADRLKSSSDDR